MDPGLSSRDRTISTGWSRLTWIKATGCPRRYRVPMLRDRAGKDFLLLSLVKAAAIAAILTRVLPPMLAGR